MSKQAKKNSSGHNRPGYMTAKFKFEQQELKLDVDLSSVIPKFSGEIDPDKKCEFV